MMWDLLRKSINGVVNKVSICGLWVGFVKEKKYLKLFFIDTSAFFCFVLPINLLQKTKLKVNISNLQNVIVELLNENLLRGKGLLARAIIKAQMVKKDLHYVWAFLFNSFFVVVT